ncbi:MAG TPA: ribosome biogenesis GTPase Der [Campylobacterales bacterium]|nr:ribosome biogenesis GTPase Der [Campylobacterales bacterium]
MIKIALIGKPNVGKSSLFNRISRRWDAITSDVSGTTRDIKKREVLINQTPALLIDTGGLDDATELFTTIKAKSLKAAREADIVLYMVDGKTLPDDEDKKLFYELQSSCPILALVVNKLDNDKSEEEMGWEFSNFGAHNLFFISVSHNRGTKKLINWIDSEIPKEEAPELELEEDDEFSLEDFIAPEEIEIAEEEESNEIKVAIIGRVNVGKSSLLNALVGEDRSVVSPIAGTTVDPVDEQFEYKDKLITFVDTAGIRKRGKIEGLEKHALQRTQKMLETANVALLVIDSSCEFKELDEKIAHLVDKFGLGVMIVLNKWDMAMYDYEKSVEKVRERFKFLSYAPVITISALTHQRVHKLNDKILEIYDNYSRRIPTSKLNEAIKIANSRHHLPSDNGQLIKIYFATQFETKPPRIALIMNRPKSLHFSTKRYLVNQLRGFFNFEGTQIILEPKKKKSNEDYDS